MILFPQNCSCYWIIKDIKVYHFKPIKPHINELNFWEKLKNPNLGVFLGFVHKLRSFPKIWQSVSYPLNRLTSWLTLKPSYVLHFFLKKIFTDLLTDRADFIVQFLPKDRNPTILFYFSCSFLPQASLELHKKHVSLESTTARSVNWHFSAALLFPNQNKTFPQMKKPNAWSVRSYTKIGCILASAPE